MIEAVKDSKTVIINIYFDDTKREYHESQLYAYLSVESLINKLNGTKLFVC